MYYGIDAICLKNVYKLYMSFNSIPKFCFWANYRQKDAQRTFQNEHTNHRHSLEQGVAVDKIGGRACQTPKKELPYKNFFFIQRHKIHSRFCSDYVTRICTVK